MDLQTNKVNKNYKVIFMPLPYSGHLNPLAGIAYDLASRKNVDVIFYSTEAFEKLIKKTGAEYRSYKSFKITKNTPEIIVLLNELLDTSESILMDLVDEIKKEKPDLIIYDFMALHTKFLLDYLNINHAKDPVNVPKAPPSISISLSFCMLKGIYPNKLEENNYLWAYNSIPIIKFMLLVIKQIRISFKFGLKTILTVERVFRLDSDLKIVTILEDLQPRFSLFDDSYYFVGCCAPKEVRSDQALQEPFASFLKEFDPINPIKMKENLYLEQTMLDSKQLLIYISLGTAFSFKIAVFEQIIKAIELINQDIMKKKFFSNILNFKAIVSFGSQHSYEAFDNMKIKNNLSIPENVLLVPFAPQIDILERCSLFITHAGMNSVCESIHYGVPMLCVPIAADQHLVAYRICDELGLGAKIDIYKKNELDQTHIKGLIIKMLSNKAYSERLLRLTCLSRINDGSKKAGEKIVQYIKSSVKKID
jgi:UDP:flavonoid glycosyltransferase YjiC (YdhE family)